MSVIDSLFTKLKADGRKALIPFVTAGDPDIGTTARLLRAAIRGGADLCEVGVPYSDPIADGPVIQASYQRSLDRGFKLSHAFDLGRDMTGTTTPLVTMISYAIIYRVGIARYITMAKESGYAGAIVPDLLVEEAAELSAICRAEDFNLIQLVTPTTPRDRQLRIAESTTGFIYYVSVTGITGERTKLPENLIDNVRWLRSQTAIPVCIGFGVSGPDIAQSLAPHADGLIVGSAIVRRIAESKTPELAEKTIESFVRELRQAIDRVT